MVRKFLTALLLCAAFGGQATLAAPVTYDESVSGDINFNTFVFDVGTNTISGVMRFVSLFDSAAGRYRVVIDFDTFFFTFGADDVVTSIGIGTSFTPVVPGETFDVRLDWLLLDEVGSQASTTCQVVFGPPQQLCLGSAGLLFADAVPLSLDFTGGVYQLGVNNASWSAPVVDVSYGGNVAYTLTVNVQSKSVPEPGTLTLLGLGLVGLVALRRRKH